ncbi:MAG: cellulase family glycosylhydrolase [Anaerolineales bacterium]|nr:cellulase family glycosylhydrolase [Anaerolineales bacterium]
MRAGRGWAALAGLALAAAACLVTQWASLHAWLFALTGEENGFAQVRAAGHLLGDLVQPPLNLQAEVPIAGNGVNPFGINTFLQQEVEPAKRERQVQLIAEAGFHWLRQEFPWADIEIHGRGNFDDCRNPPGCISAWSKYDQIVDLAEQAGLELLVRLSSPPDWSRADGGRRGPFAPPDDFNDFAAYAAAVAERYRGRVRYYQIWNEPNGNDEWGYQPVDPEAYTRLLCLTYHRLKAVDPGNVVLAAALTPTNELGGANPNGLGGDNLNDLIYLQRMYAAGAKPCFDVLSVQGYGLWSAPGDHRSRPIVINFGRNLFVRDLMVANNDAHKAIWIAEMNWNAVPLDSGILPSFGQVTLEQQARYAPLAYARAQAEWPWVGMTAFWFFKRADDSERNQSWYYFRMAEPDFTLLPVYAAMQAYTRQPPTMYPGYFQEDHWAVSWSDGWRATADASAVLGAYQLATRAGATASFRFDGSGLVLVTRQGPDAGQIAVRLDGGPQRVVDLRAAALTGPAPVSLAANLPSGAHTVEIASLAGANSIDGFIVRRAPDRTGLYLAVLAAGLGAAWYLARRGNG